MLRRRPPLTDTGVARRHRRPEHHLLGAPDAQVPSDARGATPPRGDGGRTGTERCGAVSWGRRVGARRPARAHSSPLRLQDEGTIRALLAGNANPNARTASGATPLLGAAALGACDGVRALVRVCAEFAPTTGIHLDLDAQLAVDRATALHVAAYLAVPEMVRLLLEARRTRLAGTGSCAEDRHSPQRLALPRSVVDSLSWLPC